jgi:hypothetical protein
MVAQLTFCYHWPQSLRLRLADRAHGFQENVPFPNVDSLMAAIATAARTTMRAACRRSRLRGSL